MHTNYENSCHVMSRDR